VLVLEGFGKLPMNPRTFKLLSTNARREVALNAENWDRYANTRPEIVIPLPGSDNVAEPNETGVFAPDRVVRVLRSPRIREIGTLTALREMAVFPSGIRAPAGEVRFDDGQSLTVPLANLEIVG
jgi:hypothetical protein